jgi:hypothetical protein
MVQSEATPGTGVAGTGAATGRWQTAGRHDEVTADAEADPEGVVGDDEGADAEGLEAEQPASSDRAIAPTSAGRTVRARAVAPP